MGPGLIDTPIYDTVSDDPAAFTAQLAKQLGTTEELARVVLECLLNDYLNAETIRGDGGIRMPRGDADLPATADE